MGSHEKNGDRTREEKYRQYFEDATLFDDWYMQVFMEGNIACAQLMIRVCLNKTDLRVIRLIVQKNVPRETPDEKGACLDIWAKDSKNETYNIEIQDDSRDSSPRRAFHYLAKMVLAQTPKGIEFVKRKNCYVIFITKHDVLKGGKPCYWLCGYDSEGKDSDIGAYIVYINGAWKGDDAIGRLVSDMKNANYRTMHYPEMAARTHDLKVIEKEGNMSSLVDVIREDLKDEIREDLKDEIREDLKDEIREEVKDEVREEVWGEVRDEIRDEREKFVMYLLNKGDDLQAIESVTHISLSRIKELQASMKDG